LGRGEPDIVEVSIHLDSDERVCGERFEDLGICDVEFQAGREVEVREFGSMDEVRVASKVVVFDGGECGTQRRVVGEENA